MKYNPEEHYRRSIRLKNYDYKKSGYYFITVCSKNRECIFSTLNNINVVGAGLASAQISLTNIGDIIERNWIDLPNQYENVYLDEYIIMPNHIHGICIIDSSKRADARPAPTTFCDIICSFKSRCFNDNLQRINSNNLNEIAKLWQRNYYEHIIRNDKELEKIRQYIYDNPYKWDEDENNPNNLN